MVGTLLIWATESGRQGGDINGIGDSAFFCAVQLLTISSSIKNPLTPMGKIYPKTVACGPTQGPERLPEACQVLPPVCGDAAEAGSLS